MTNNAEISIRIPLIAKMALQEVAKKLNRKSADVARIALLEYLREKGQAV
jgi:hypothetical protein